MGVWGFGVLVSLNLISLNLISLIPEKRGQLVADEGREPGREAPSRSLSLSFVRLQ